MATFKYFTTCGGEQVELFRVIMTGISARRPDSFEGTCPTCSQRHKAQRYIEMKRNPSRHECNAKCMSGSVRGACECRCGGKNHGVAAFTCAQVQSQAVRA